MELVSSSKKLALQASKHSKQASTQSKQALKASKQAHTKQHLKQANVNISGDVKT